MKLELNVNQLIEIEMEYNGQKVILASRIEGIEETCLVIAAPIRKGVPLIAPPGHKMVIIVRIRQSSYGFNSSLLGRRLRPVPIWLIQKPAEYFKVGQKRTYVRLNVNLPICFKCANDKEALAAQGTSVDISAGGVLFTTQHPPESGERLQVELFLNEKEVICSNARVIRVFDQLLDGVHSYRVAVEFDDITEGQRDRIFRFIFEKQREWLRKGLLQ